MKPTPGAERYARRFDLLRRRNEGAFVPFLVAGDPDPRTSADLLDTLARSGADALEIGLPFSDPVADGPVIQAAAARALGAGVRVADCWAIIRQVRDRHPELPIGLLVYANLVVHRGAPAFYRAAAEAGVDSVLVADAPVLEADPLREAAREAGVASVLITPPNASPERLRGIAARSDAYVYVTSRPGVTGADERLRADSAQLFRMLDELRSAPALLGFGISTPGQVREALRIGAAGAISGSALVARIPEGRDRPDVLLETAAAFTRSMKAATVRSGEDAGDPAA